MQSLYSTNYFANPIQLSNHIGYFFLFCVLTFSTFYDTMCITKFYRGNQYVY